MESNTVTERNLVIKLFIIRNYKHLMHAVLPNPCQPLNFNELYVTIVSTRMHMALDTWD